MVSLSLSYHVGGDWSEEPPWIGLTAVGEAESLLLYTELTTDGHGRPNILYVTDEEIKITREIQ